MDIRLRHAADIDTLRWDSCVHYATHPSFSGYTWFLNAWSKDWVGLVEGDYESVMPLFITRDWLGRKSHVQPSWLVPTGPFSIHMLNRPRILAFLRQLPPRVVDALLPWEGTLGLEGVESTLLARPLLELDKTYEEIRNGFSPRMTEDPAWTDMQWTPEQFTAFAGQVATSADRRRLDIHAMHRIMYQAMHRGLGFLSVVGRTPGRPAAAAFFVLSGGILYRLFGARDPGVEGRAATRFLVDLIIRSHAGRPLVLDLNGLPEALDLGPTIVNYIRVNRRA